MRKSMLEPWLNGNESITPENLMLNNSPNFEYGAFIGFDECIELYRVNEFDSGNLKDSWRNTKDYINSALELIQGDINECSFGYLDNEEKDWILNELGEPPLGSYNIYLITIYNENEEKIVYIGKTDSKKSRFSNGHLAALKLYNPIYDSYKKRVYFGTIMFLDSDSNYLPLEYITPLEKAQELLNNTEKLLINHFKPELNTQNLYILENELKVNFHIQNFTETKLFKGDVFIYHSH